MRSETKCLVLLAVLVLLLPGCGSQASGNAGAGANQAVNSLAANKASNGSSATSTNQAASGGEQTGSGPQGRPLLGFHSLQMETSNTGWAIAYGRIIRTTNGGKHWQDVSPRGLTLPTKTYFGPPGSLVLEASGANRALFTVQDASNNEQSILYQTTDGGQSWQAATIPTTHIISLVFDNNGHGWLVSTPGGPGAGSAGAMFYTQPGPGDKWQRAQLTYPRGNSPHLAGYLGMAVSSHGPWFTGVRIQPAQGTPGVALLASGKQVTIKPLPVPSDLQHDLSMVYPPKFTASGYGLLLVYYTRPVQPAASDHPALVIYTTTDGGNHWKVSREVNADLNYKQQYQDVDYAVSGKRRGWVLVGKNLYAERANGSWVKTSTGINPEAPGNTRISFVGAQYGWVYNSWGTRVTKDGGKTWHTIDMTLPPGAKPQG